MSKSQQSQRRVVTKLVEISRPVKIKVMRGSRGVRWEVSVHAATVDDAMTLLQQAEEKLHASYGPQAERYSGTEQKVVERELAIAKNGIIYGTLALTSGGVSIRPSGIRVYVSDRPVGWLLKKFLPSFTKNAKIKVEEQNGEIQSIEIRDWKPDMKSLNELAERAAWSFSAAATKPPRQQPEKKEGESK